MQKINKLKKINIGGDLPLDYGFLRNKKNNDINFYNKKFNYSLNSGRAAIFLSLMIIKTKLKKFRAFLPYYCCPSIIQNVLLFSSVSLFIIANLIVPKFNNF